jgi:hypothetical protein
MNSIDKMRYLKVFQIFEKYDPEDILEYFQDMIDNDLGVIHEVDFNGRGQNCIEISVPNNWSDMNPDENIVNIIGDLQEAYGQFEKVSMYKFFGGFIKGVTQKEVDWDKISHLKSLFETITRITGREVVEVTRSEGYEPHHDYIFRIVF